MQITKITCNNCGTRNWINKKDLDMKEGTVKDFYISEMLVLYGIAKDNLDTSQAMSLLEKIRELSL
jgi:hypothetical protein